jgi:aminopeptidase-like protein
MIGQEMHALARRLWPINRSLTGDGVRESLRILSDYNPDLIVHEIPTGTQVFDWTIPKEWRVSEAWIKAPDGRKICDFAENNLHLVGYSKPVSGRMPLERLQDHLYSLPDQPDAIPYVTSYYKERWGFCISQNERNRLSEGEYEVKIDSQLSDGSLSYGEILIPGEREDEIFLSTYICHPSMGNNELSGPVVATYLARWVKTLADRKYSYRFVFIPETIGSIAYLSRNLDILKARVVGGFNISCVGDDRAYSYLPSRAGDTQSDKVAQHVLEHTDPDFVRYSWNDRGSDERQYCAPHIDLPIASIMRTKYGMYEEYHTSLDNLTDVVTPSGLEGGYEALRRALEVFECNGYPNVTVLCEPQMGKRGLYPTLSAKERDRSVRLMMNVISWSDGRRSLLEIAELCGVPVWELYTIISTLKDSRLLELSDSASLNG